MSQNHMDKLIEILAYLRLSPDGCAWTKEQTHKSITSHLIEEAYETAEKIDEGKYGDELRDELGDLLLQVALHAQFASERGAFKFDDVAKAIVDKLERRYPTILGNEANTLKTPEEIDRRWEEVKAQERLKKNAGAEGSIFDGISHAIPALMRAAKLKGRAAKEGWEWPDPAMAFDKVIEEIDELRAEIEAEKVDKERVAAEIGDLLFMIADLGRLYGVDVEDALRTTNNRIEQRLRYMETGLKRMGKSIKASSIQERRAMWDEAKTAEKQKKVS